MRRVLLGVLALTLLSTVLASATSTATATAGESADRSSATPGLVVRYRYWGPLKLGMNHREAWRTGMVSHQGDRCAPGYQMKERYRDRGFVVWRGELPRMRVGMIVVRGEGDKTLAGAHAGSTLHKLRELYGERLRLRRGSALDGRADTGPDLWVATVRKRHANLNFHFAYGRRPGPRSTVQYIVIARKPSVYWGC